MIRQQSQSSTSSANTLNNDTRRTQSPSSPHADSNANSNPNPPPTHSSTASNPFKAFEPLDWNRLEHHYTNTLHQLTTLMRNVIAALKCSKHSLSTVIVQLAWACLESLRPGLPLSNVSRNSNRIQNNPIMGQWIDAVRSEFHRTEALIRNAIRTFQLPSPVNVNDDNSDDSDSSPSHPHFVLPTCTGTVPISRLDQLKMFQSQLSNALACDQTSAHDSNAQSTLPLLKVIINLSLMRLRSFDTEVEVEEAISNEFERSKRLLKQLGASIGSNVEFDSCLKVMAKSNCDVACDEKNCVLDSKIESKLDSNSKSDEKNRVLDSNPKIENSDFKMESSFYLNSKSDKKNPVFDSNSKCDEKNFVLHSKLDSNSNSNDQEEIPEFIPKIALNFKKPKLDSKCDLNSKNQKELKNNSTNLKDNNKNNHSLNVVVVANLLKNLQMKNSKNLKNSISNSEDVLSKGKMDSNSKIHDHHVLFALNLFRSIETFQRNLFSEDTCKDRRVLLQTLERFRKTICNFDFDFWKVYNTWSDDVQKQVEPEVRSSELKRLELISKLWRELDYTEQLLHSVVDSNDSNELNSEDKFDYLQSKWDPLVMLSRYRSAEFDSKIRFKLMAEKNKKEKSKHSNSNANVQKCPGDDELASPTRHSTMNPCPPAVDPTPTHQHGPSWIHGQPYHHPSIMVNPQYLGVNYRTPPTHPLPMYTYQPYGYRSNSNASLHSNLNSNSNVIPTQATTTSSPYGGSNHHVSNLNSNPTYARLANPVPNAPISNAANSTSTSLNKQTLNKDTASIPHFSNSNLILSNPPPILNPNSNKKSEELPFSDFLRSDIVWNPENATFEHRNRSNSTPNPYKAANLNSNALNLFSNPNPNHFSTGILDTSNPNTWNSFWSSKRNLILAKRSNSISNTSNVSPLSLCRCKDGGSLASAVRSLKSNLEEAGNVIQVYLDAVQIRVQETVDLFARPKVTRRLTESTLALAAEHVQLLAGWDIFDQLRSFETLQVYKCSMCHSVISLPADLKSQLKQRHFYWNRELTSAFVETERNFRQVSPFAQPRVRRIHRPWSSVDCNFVSSEELAQLLESFESHISTMEAGLMPQTESGDDGSLEFDALTASDDAQPGSFKGCDVMQCRTLSLTESGQVGSVTQTGSGDLIQLENQFRTTSGTTELRNQTGSNDPKTLYPLIEVFLKLARQHETLLDLALAEFDSRYPMLECNGKFRTTPKGDSKSDDVLSSQFENAKRYLRQFTVMFEKLKNSGGKHWCADSNNNSSNGEEIGQEMDLVELKIRHLMRDLDSWGERNSKRSMSGSIPNSNQCCPNQGKSDFMNSICSTLKNEQDGKDSNLCSNADREQSSIDSKICSNQENTSKNALNSNSNVEQESKSSINSDSEPKGKKI